MWSDDRPKCDSPATIGLMRRKGSRRDGIATVGASIEIVHLVLVAVDPSPPSSSSAPPLPVLVRVLPVCCQVLRH